MPAARARKRSAIIRRVYRWIDHTAELELHIEAPTAAGVLAEAAAALAELLGGGGGEPAGTRTVAVEACDRAALLAAFVEELVYLAESEQLVPTGVREIELGEGRVRAEVELERGDPPHLVKAVTYHRLAFEPHGPGYRATAVLDV
jgi:SHS2 domain-containing protein